MSFRNVKTKFVVRNQGKQRTLRHCFALAAVFAVIGVVSAVESEDEEELVSAGNGELEITSDSLDMSFAERKAAFRGNVKVKDERMTLTADKMDVYLTDQNELQRIEAIGNVMIKEKNTARQANAGKATYDVQNETVTLTDKPSVQMEEDSIMNAAVIVYYRETETFTFRGDEGERPRLRFTPTKVLKEDASEGQNE